MPAPQQYRKRTQGSTAAKPVRTPFKNPSYVDMKDAQVDTEYGRLRGAAQQPNLDRMKAFNAAQSGGGGVAAFGGSGGSGGGAREEVSENTDQWDGWAGEKFVPGQRDLLFDNPDIIVREWLKQGAYKNNPQMAGDLSRYANIVFGDDTHGGLYELLTAGSLNPKVIGDDDMINYLADLLGEQSKVGGRSPSVGQMLQLLFEGFNNPDSTMGGMLTSGGGDDVTTGQAINAVMQFIPLLGEFTGNRRYSDALYKQASRLAQDYMDMAATGKNKGSFLDFFQDNYLR